MWVGDLEASASFGVIRTVLDRLARGDKIFSLAIGEPLYDTPEEIMKNASEDMMKGDTHYTSSLGINEVRDAITAKVKSKNSINAELKNSIFMSSRHAIYSTLLALGNRKGEVLVPDPGYFYSNPTKLAGFDPVSYYLAEDNSLDASLIEDKITDRTTAIFLNTPSNPTGRVAERKVLEEVFELAEKHDLKIISDEAYEDLVYEKKHISVGSMEDAPDRVISIFSLSKSYSMTGWRAGYTIAEESIISNMAKVMDHTFSCYPPFVQHASAYALRHGDKFVRKFQSEFREKRDLIEKRLRGIHGVVSSPIEGAFYAFPRYEKSIGSSELASNLLEKENVAVLPGVAFGDRGEKHIRISFSGSLEILDEGMNRLAEYMNNLPD